MQIYFCERCGKRVSDVDLEKGHGVMIEELAYCDACAAEEGLYEVARAATQQAQTLPTRPSTKRLVRHGSSRARISAARAAPQSVPVPVSGLPKWIYGAIFGSAVLLVVALIFAFGGSGGSSEPRDERRTPPVARTPEPEKKPEPDRPRETPRRPVETPPVPPAPPEPSFVLKAPPSALRPAAALVLADFDYVTAGVDAVSSPHRAEVKSLEGNQAVVVHKTRGDMRSGATLKLLFGKPLDLSAHNTLSLYLVAGPEPTQVSVGLNQAGSAKYLKTVDGRDLTEVGTQWTQHDFRLSEDAKNVYGLILKFNAGGRQEAFTLSADEILAYGKGETLVAHVPSIGNTAAVPSVTSPSRSPVQDKHMVLDFETPVDFRSKYEQPAEITQETAHSGKSCMKVRVGPGMKNTQSSRLIISLSAPVDFSRAKGFELFVKLEGIEENRGSLAALGDDEKSLPTDQKWDEWQFDYKSGDWQRIYFDMDTTAALRSVPKVANYFNYRKNECPFTFYVDD